MASPTMINFNFSNCKCHVKFQWGHEIHIGLKSNVFDRKKIEVYVKCGHERHFVHYLNYGFVFTFYGFLLLGFSMCRIMSSLQGTSRSNFLISFVGLHFVYNTLVHKMVLCSLGKKKTSGPLAAEE